MDALRSELRAWLWDGEFRGTVGATVADAATGAAHPTFSRFEAADGTSALVVCNYSADPVAVSAALENGAPLSRYRAIEDSGWAPGQPGGLVRVAGRSAVVVM